VEAAPPGVVVPQGTTLESSRRGRETRLAPAEETLGMRDIKHLARGVGDFLVKTKGP
jgi:hypothetical protein